VYQKHVQKGVRSSFATARNCSVAVVTIDKQIKEETSNVDLSTAVPVSPSQTLSDYIRHGVV
jgi:hypothetical protein